MNLTTHKAFHSEHFGEPRSPNTILQIKSAARLHRSSGRWKCFHKLFPSKAPWSVQVVTDWGDEGKRLKAQIRNYSGGKKNAQIFDLSHDIEPFAIRQAAFFLESNLKLFLPNSICVCVVDPTVGTKRQAIVAEAGNRSFFVGPNNGVFDLVLRSLNRLYGIRQVVEIDRESRHVLSLSDGAISVVDGDAIFTPAAGAILRYGKIPHDLGRQIPLSKFGEKCDWEGAREQNGSVIGRIERIDHYGTYVTNISPDLLFPDGKTHGLSLKMTGKQSRYEIIVPYLDHFAQVTRGKPLALLQGNAFLHIAVNLGRADESMKFLVSEQISVEKIYHEEHLVL